MCSNKPLGTKESCCQAMGDSASQNAVGNKACNLHCPLFLQRFPFCERNPNDLDISDSWSVNPLPHMPILANSAAN